MLIFIKNTLKKIERYDSKLTTIKIDKEKDIADRLD